MTHEEFQEATKQYEIVKEAQSRIKVLSSEKKMANRVTTIISYGGNDQYGNGHRDYSRITVKDAVARPIIDAHFSKEIAAEQSKIDAACRRLAQLGCAPPKGVA